MYPFFYKDFNDFDLQRVHYVKCANCGFCASETHYGLSPEEWEKLNVSFHLRNNKRTDNPFNRKQRKAHQSHLLWLLKRFDFFNGDSFLDWGAGEGKLSIMCQKLYGLKLNNCDKYIQPQINALRESQLSQRSFDLVLNCAVLEHVTSRSTMDEIESLVSPEGALGLHTLVLDDIPNNPEWPYLLPVHCSFLTRKSMRILMEQWGYTSSVSNDDAKMWIMFKGDSEVVRHKVETLNSVFGLEFLLYSKGFAGMKSWSKE